jgi:hypothetical protein
MKEEIEAAATWWADKIAGTPKQDNGDLRQSMLATWAQSKYERPTPDQVAAFKEILKGKLEKYLSDHWCGDNPSFGSYYRTLKTDYDPDAILSSAASEAGIKIRYCATFPMKTVMWINPGEVLVACGYGARPEVVYSK